MGVRDTVIWRNDAAATTHTSTSGTTPTPNGVWDSGFLGAGGTFQYVPLGTGTFPYFCQVHTFMTATLTVNAGQMAGVGDGGAARTRLLAARPNPARRDVLLRFELAQAGAARLILTDASGREVASLVDGRLDAGRHELHWNGRTASGQPAGAGVYYYRLTAGSYSSTRKFTWIR